MKRVLRNRVAILLAMLVSGSVLTTLPATPAVANVPGPNDRHGGEAGRGPSQHTVTLITGDRVLVTDSGAGGPQVRVAGQDPGGYEIRREGDDVYVIPARAESALAAGRVDRELFNVTGLVEQGYHDAGTDTIPVIASYNVALRRVPTPPAGTETVAELPSIRAAALRVDKRDAATAWDAMVPLTRIYGAAVRKLWLDGRVRATLDQSVPQVGAPAAWAKGWDGTGSKVAVLDSGVDAGHPDLVDSVVAAQNFTTAADVSDRNGHGTHVASTVAGTGAASSGAKRGVAPGADLLVGKVLDDTGYGQLSWIIAGMEWAVAQHADVVNMSIGSYEATDCTDPMAQAVNNLSATSDSLFVIAAGNLGGPAETVTSPGCAAAALTVGAVDSDGATASFSSRGPVLSTHAVKPDLVAPGVDITAARAGGRGDAAYTELSGTSMATPHVAGAAAILAQQHPEWDGERIKAALQSTARPDSKTDVYEQGAGVLDVAAAVEHTVSGPSTIDLGTFTWPHTSDETVVREVRYLNTGDTAHTLTFALDARGETGAQLPADAVRVGGAELTIPAGGSAVLPLIIDPSADLSYADYGALSARIIAVADDGQSVVTAVGAYVEPKHVDITVRVLDPDGKPAKNWSTLDVLDMDSIAAQRISLEGEDVILRLRAGTYSIATTVLTPSEDSIQPTSVAFLAEPEITLIEDQTIVLDARRAHRVRLQTDKPAELHSGSLSYARTVDQWVLNSSRIFGSTVEAMYLGETTNPRRGEFEVVEGWQLVAPPKTDHPYEYDLVFAHQGQVKGQQIHTVNSRSLAAVTSEYHTPGDPDQYVEYFDAWRAVSETYIPVGDTNEVAAPGRVTHYLTPGHDIRIRQTVVHPDGTLWFWGTAMRSETVTRKPGSHTTETWFRAGLRPGIPSSPLLGRYDTAGRENNRIWTNLAGWSDTEPGHSARDGLTGPSTSVELLRDGESLGKEHWFGEGRWAVPADEHDYELVYQLDRYERPFSTWTSPNTSETRWRFRSSASDSGSPLPLLFPDYDLDVDLANTAPAKESYPVRIQLEATPGYAPGDIQSTRAWASYDEGASWDEVTLVRQGGQLTAYVDNRPAANGSVSFRFHATDTNGVSVTQTINRLYRVR